VRRIHEEVGATSIFVTHDQIEAMTLADRLVVMRDGEIQQVGAPSTVYDTPQSLYVAKFIGSPSMGTFGATYVAKARNLALDDGQRLAVGDRLRAVADGTRIVAGIRPEALRFAERDEGLSACLRFSEELGSARLHHFAIAGETVAMVASDKRPIAGGSTVQIRAEPQDLHFFDAQTGCRLAE